jgi:DNA repair protein REV1
VQKLETNSAASSISLGQAVLPFKAQVPINAAKGSTSKDIVHKPEIVVQPPSQEDITMDDPVKPSHTFDLPSFSQVDMSVLEALPRDLREELEMNIDDGQLRHLFLELFPRTIQVIAASVQPLNNNRQSVGPPVFPQKPKSQTNYKCITRQPAKSKFSYAWALPKKKKNNSQHQRGKTEGSGT